VDDRWMDPRTIGPSGGQVGWSRCWRAATVMVAPTEGPLDLPPEVTPEEALDPAPASSLDLLQQCRRCGSENGTERGTFHRTIHRSGRGSSSVGVVSCPSVPRGTRVIGAAGAHLR
jgi:hypothetical protein